MSSTNNILSQNTVYISDQKLIELAEQIDKARVSFQRLNGALENHHVYIDNEEITYDVCTSTSTAKKEKTNQEKITELLICAKQTKPRAFSDWLTKQVDYPFITEWLYSLHSLSSYLVMPNLVDKISEAICTSNRNKTLDRQKTIEVFVEYHVNQNKATRVIDCMGISGFALNELLIEVYDREALIGLAINLLPHCGDELKQTLTDSGVMAESKSTICAIELKNALSQLTEDITLMTDVYKRLKESNRLIAAKDTEIVTSKELTVDLMLNVLSSSGASFCFAREILMYRNWPMLKLWLRKYQVPNSASLKH